MNVKIKAMLAYVVIFLLGGASGFILHEAINPDITPYNRFENRPGFNGEFQRPRGGPGFGGPGMQRRMAMYLSRELDLSKDQREPFFNLLEEHLQSLHVAIREQKSEEATVVRNLYSNFLNKADEILTEEQIKELNRVAHPDSVHQRRMQRRPANRGIR